MTTNLFPWQGAAWQQLQTLRANLPHALLFHGAAGIGKTVFAEAFAAALLCEALQEDGQACGTCLSCGWLMQYSHPDFRRVRPEALEDDSAEQVDEAELKKTAKSSKAPSKDIRIEQVRALSNFMNLSTHRQGRRVVLLYPAEALNSASANALLKTLEEPPPATVFLLVSNSLDRLLPTILSRCRKFALPLPSTTEATCWLASQKVSDAARWIAEQGGAPLAALEASQSEASDDLEIWLSALAQPSIEGALKAAEKLQKSAPAELILWLQRWLHDLFLVKMCGDIRYYPRYQKQLITLSQRVSTHALSQALDDATERRAIAEHPLSPRLFLEDTLVDYSRLFS